MPLEFRVSSLGLHEPDASSSERPESRQPRDRNQRQHPPSRQRRHLHSSGNRHHRKTKIQDARAGRDGEKVFAIRDLLSVVVLLIPRLIMALSRWDRHGEGEAKQREDLLASRKGVYGVEDAVGNCDRLARAIGDRDQDGFDGYRDLRIDPRSDASQATRNLAAGREREGEERNGDRSEFHGDPP
jgi:hypothetical protein